MAKKVVITGASGLLGRELYRHFTNRGWKCLGLAYSRCRGDLVKVDLRNKEDVKKLLVEFSPQVVVHAAAERRPDVVANQADHARNLNVTVTEQLTQLCRETGTFLLYISTDYVFDGKSPPYHPSSLTNPLNSYGVTKRDGELFVKEYEKGAILRVPVLYGEVEDIGESAVTTLLTAVQNVSQSVRLSDYEQRYPTHVRDVAELCETLCDRQVKEPGVGKGVWHCSGDDCLTKYSMACVIGKVLGLPTGHLVAVKEPSSGAPRPYNSHLDTSSTRAMFQTSVTPFEAGIAAVLSK